MGIWRQIVRQPPFQPQPVRKPLAATGSSLSAGTASFVSSGPATIIVTATGPSGGTPGYTLQWQRNEDGGSWSNLANGGGVSGATSATLTDGSVSVGILYGYRQTQTDSIPNSVTTNEVFAEAYVGGALEGGDAVFPVIGSLIVFGVRS